MSTKLTGTITVHGSKPATTAVVELKNSKGDVVDQVQVTDQGGYAYHLSAGSWTLNVWDGHGHRGSAEIEISGDGVKQFDLDLDEPEGGH
jgi:hypothetical protein